MEVLVAPIPGLAGADPGEFNQVAGLGPAIARHPLGVLGRLEIDPSLTTPPADPEIPASDRCRGTTNFGGTGRVRTKGVAPIGVAPIITGQILAGHLEAKLGRKPGRVPEADPEDPAVLVLGRGPRHRGRTAPVSALDRDRGSGRGERRLGDDVKDPIGDVGSVERRARSEHELDLFDIVVGGREKRRHVDPERRHRGIPVVDQRQERPGEDVVETARHDVGLDQTAFGERDPRNRLQMVEDREGGPLLNSDRRDHRNAGWGVVELFGDPGHRADPDFAELVGAVDERRRDRCGTTGGHRHAIEPFCPIRDQNHGNRIDPGRQPVDPKSPIGSANRRPGTPSAGVAHRELGAAQTNRTGTVGNPAGNGTGLGRQPARQEPQSDHQQPRPDETGHTGPRSLSWKSGPSKRPN